MDEAAADVRADARFAPEEERCARLAEDISGIIDRAWPIPADPEDGLGGTMRPRNDTSKLFGHYDVIDRLKEKLRARLSRVHTPVSFDRLEDYMEELRVDIPRLGDHRIGDRVEGRFPAGKEAFTRNCSPNDPVPGWGFALEIPFEGDGEVFKHTPSSWFMSGLPAGRIRDGYISANFYVLDADEETMKQHAVQRIAEIKVDINKWFEKAEADFEAWNEGLRDLVADAISSRKREIEKDAEKRRAVNEIIREF